MAFKLLMINVFTDLAFSHEIQRLTIESHKIKNSIMYI